MSIRCYFCGADTEAQRVTVDERWDGHLVSVDDVPADVCPQCGEVYYGPEAVRRLEDLRQQQEPAATIQVPVYTFAAGRAEQPAAKTRLERPVAGRRR
jgi:YgiT-type zinc finger domain-containing protein